jgi:hypothetical protein
MIETPLAVLSEGQALAFERAAQALRVQRQQAPAAVQDTDRVIDKASRSALELRETWYAAWQSVENSDASELGRLGRLLRDLFSRWHKLLVGMRDDLQGVVAEGHLLLSTPVLLAAIAEVERLQQALEKNWPWPERPYAEADPEMIRQAEAEIARGECDVFEVGP